VVIADAFDTDGRKFPVSASEARAINPRLIWCSISPHGEKGPLANQPGSELTVQAMSNSWAGLGAIGKPPLRMGADQASMTAGIFAYQGILAALYRRERIGRGDAVSVSALGAILSIKGMHWTSLSNPDDWPGLHLRVWTDPPSNGYRTADLPILFGLMSRTGGRSDPRSIPGLFAALGGEMPAGLDPIAMPGAPSNPSSPEWRPLFERLFAGRGWEELRRIFMEHGGEVTPFTDYSRLDLHPQTQALQPFAPLAVEGGGMRVVRVPWRMSAYPDGFDYLAPIDAAVVQRRREQP
jgi:crotonobetainyl-CoA:carnitine CoA-transferase CaiB-like acyl-CoA transferase